MIGGLSMTEVVIILGLALLLLGPDQLPTLARSLGKGLKELRKATDDLKSTFEQEMAKIEHEPQPPTQNRIMAAPPPPPAPTAGDPGSARALARSVAVAAPAAGGGDDPAAARAAARRAAAALKLVPPEGTVPASEKKP